MIYDNDYKSHYNHNCYHCRHCPLFSLSVVYPHPVHRFVRRVPINTWGGGRFTRTANPSSRSRAGRATPDSSTCEEMMHLSPWTGINALSHYPRPRGLIRTSIYPLLSSEFMRAIPPTSGDNGIMHLPPSVGINISRFFSMLSCIMHLSPPTGGDKCMNSDNGRG